MVSASAKPSVEGMKPLPYSTIQVPELHWTDVASPTACTMVSPVRKEGERYYKNLANRVCKIVARTSD